MEEIFEKLYNEYLIVLQKLEIGYGIRNCNLNEVWKLIQLLYFIKFGNPTESEYLWIADKYETVGSFIEDIDFDV